MTIRQQGAPATSMTAAEIQRQYATALRTIATCAVSSTGRIEFNIQRILRSPNTFLGMHWREKNRERKAWQVTFTNAIVDALGVPAAQALLGPDSGLHGAKGGCQAKRRLEVIRCAPSRRNFVRDDDNLTFALKPVLDALKHCGLLKDDRREWLERPTVTQDLSADKTFWTRIVIDAASGAQA